MEQKYKDDTMMTKHVNGVFLVKDTIVFYIFFHFQVYVDTNSFIEDKYHQRRKATSSLLTV